jgi:hypothetical protein
MIVERHAIFTLPRVYTPDDNDVKNFDPVAYSKFKHGCQASISHFADQLSKIIDALALSEPIKIASSAYLNTPTAATLLVDKLLNNYSYTARFTKVKLSRSNIIAEDYATLNLAERKKAMGNIQLQTDLNVLRNQTLVVVDDSLLTGAHESIITQHLTGVCARLIYIYILDMSACITPNIEVKMNNFEIRAINQLLPYMQQIGYVVNSRVLKMIFSDSDSSFKNFVAQLSIPQQDEILLQAEEEGYMLLGGDFSKKMKHLKTCRTANLTRTMGYFRESLVG